MSENQAEASGAPEGNPTPGEPSFGEDLAAIKADLSRLGSRVARVTSKAAAQARVAGKQRWAEMRKNLEVARARGQAATESTRKQVKEHPLSAVGIAFGAGFLTGSLFRRF